MRAGTTELTPSLESSNSTFQYVHRTSFDFRGSGARSTTTAPDVASWLHGALERGIDRFWLLVPEPEVAKTAGGAAEQVLVAFAGAGQWFLVGTSGERSREIWWPSWAVGDADASDGRIWDVDYRGESLDRAGMPLRPDVFDSAQRLTAELESAEAFARVHRLDVWADWFADARRFGEGDDPQPPYHPDMFPARGFAKPARRLLAMATRAWVFGGMGSWNDLTLPAPEEEEEYNRASASLYSAVLAAFVAAVNADLEA